MNHSWAPIPILMYHAVESTPRPPQYKHFYVLADEFARQMRALKRAGYTALTFGDLAAMLRGDRPSPPHPILLTFDDGYANLWDNVHPLMRDLGMPYTVFLVSEKVGTNNDWVEAERYEPTPLLNWEQIRQMQRDGLVDFQAHTATHPHLAQMPLPEARREMTDCKATLERELQKPVDVLCYPYGNVDDDVAAAARDIGFTMAVTTQTGRVRQGDDALRLPRLSVYHVPPLSLTYGVGILNFWWRVKTWKDKRP
jgi:peptidoglycan/xylan/chitin deacetylase (PgdA/CDA1 family)